MKSLHLIAVLVLISLFTPSVSGQTNKPCNNFDCAYKKAENFLKQAAYQKALDNLDSAEGYLTDTNTKEKEQIKQLRRRLFVAIEKEKEDAKKARETAYRKRKELEIEQAKNEKIIKALYFYKDKYALVYQQAEYPNYLAGDDGKYLEDSEGKLIGEITTKQGFYYIDKEGNESIKGKMFDIAFPFDESIGFARVKVTESDSIYSFLDT